MRLADSRFGYCFLHLGKLLFQLDHKRSQIRSFKPFGSGKAVTAGPPYITTYLV